MSGAAPLFHAPDPVEGAGAQRPWRVPALLVGAIAGAALQLQQPALWERSAYIACAAAGAAMVVLPRLARRVRWRRGVAWQVVMALAGALLLFGIVGLRAQAQLSTALPPEWEGRDVRVTGVVAAMPQSGESGLRFRLAVERATAPGDTAVPVPPLVDLAWYATALHADALEPDAQPGPPALRAGERWSFTVRLKAPHGLRNPHGFDYELWLWEQGVQATGTVRAGVRDAPPQRLEQTWQAPVEQARQAVRDAIRTRLVAPPDRLAADDATGTNAWRRAAGVVAALVTGDQRAIDRADWDVYRATGTAHLFSVSGLHITLFAWLASVLLGALWRRMPRWCLAVPAPTAGLVGGVALAAAYALFSGWGVPAQRTVCMLATVALLRLSGRRWPWPQVWLLACAVVVAFDPWALLQAGFWLSFVAVAVLFAAGSPPAAVAGGGWAPGAWARLHALLREQWVVTVALTPLTLLLFGQVSLVGLLANLVAIPWTTLVVTPLALAGVAVPALWTLAAWAVLPLSALLQALAAWPVATLALPAAPWWAGVAAVLGGALLVLRLPWRIRLLGGVWMLPALLWQPVPPAPGTFELLAVDVGQGQAVLVRTAQHAVLYDAGPRYSQDSDAGQRVLVPLLRALGVRLDRLVLSHRDSDHTGGAAAVLAQQPQADALGSIEDGHPLHAVRPVQRCAAGQQWTWDGVRFEVLFPPPADDLGTGKPNAHSCVLRIAPAAAPGPVALLVGDIERAQEAALVAQGAPLAADVLLVPHHGSKTSSSGVFLDAVHPRTALVQAGYRNRFGHPAPEVVARYRARGAVLIDAPACGAATWRSVAPDPVDCERTATRRYWHHAPAPM